MIDEIANLVVKVKKEVKRGSAEKLYLDREIASIEPLVESFWQWQILNCFRGLAPECFVVRKKIESYYGLFFGLKSLDYIFGNAGAFRFFAKKLCSFISTCLGVINFLRNGPFGIDSGMSYSLFKTVPTSLANICYIVIPIWNVCNCFIWWV